jgi:hypothetical protein
MTSRRAPLDEEDAGVGLVFAATLIYTSHLSDARRLPQVAD